jgi:hypothetical protein
MSRVVASACLNSLSECAVECRWTKSTFERVDRYISCLSGHLNADG